MSPGFGVMTPFNQQPATFGNGVMIAMVMDSKADVDKFYHTALSLGATDDGPPGARSDTFYAAYFRDFDGNKIAAMFAKDLAASQAIDPQTWQNRPMQFKLKEWLAQWLERWL